MVDKKALHITKDAKDITFVDCDIQGAKIEGRRTKMIRTKIYHFRHKHPSLWIGIVVSLIVSVITGNINLLIEYGYFVE